ncbi:MAG: ferredoxin [archaeon]
MAKYTITQDRDQCIGCNACASVCPENWEMKEDNKASPINTSIEEDDLDKNMEAAQSCPVNIIHIKNEGKELI